MEGACPRQGNSWGHHVSPSQVMTWGIACHDLFLRGGQRQEAGAGGGGLLPGGALWEVSPGRMHSWGLT